MKTTEELKAYLKENKEICWQLNDCNECCNWKGTNCGQKVVCILERIQKEITK